MSEKDTTQAEEAANASISVVADESVDVPADSPSEEATREEQVSLLETEARGLLAQGDWEPAVERHKQIIELMDAAGDSAGKAEALNNIASIYLALEDWEQAQAYTTEALEFYQAAGDRAGEAVVLNNVAATHDGMGDWQQAIEVYAEALEIRKSLEDAEGEAKTLRNLAILYAQHGNPIRAKSYLNRAVVMAKRAKSRELVGLMRKTLSQLPRMRRRRR
ncbi:MAG: tetratricopeptide repeat protein [Anaerolineae bacterium]|nr:tetratricopeptide repeat protein [Anaerolineae bacterium]